MAGVVFKNRQADLNAVDFDLAEVVMESSSAPAPPTRQIGRDLNNRLLIPKAVDFWTYGCSAGVPPNTVSIAL
jgi:hypothetical protein